MEARAAEGGVLLVHSADCLKDAEKSSDRLGEEALQSVTKLLEAKRTSENFLRLFTQTASMATEWPQRPFFLAWKLITNSFQTIGISISFISLCV